MALLYCPIETCKKRMVTQKILEAHLKLRHPEYKAEVSSEPVVPSKAKEPKKEVVSEPTSAEAGVQAPSTQAQPTQPVPSDEVLFRSADNRELEVSINDKVFKGKEISVPKEMAVSVRRNLEEGGFFLKD